MCNLARTRLPEKLFLDQSGDIEQEDRSDQGSQEGTEVAFTGADSEEAEDPSANDPAHDSENDVHQHAESAALHDLAGTPARQGSDDKVNKEIHLYRILRLEWIKCNKLLLFFLILAP